MSTNKKFCFIFCMTTSRLTPFIMELGGSISHSKGLLNNPYIIFPYMLKLTTAIFPVCYLLNVSLGGLGVTCSTRDPRLAGSNSAEVDGFFQDIKILSFLREGV